MKKYNLSYFNIDSDSNIEPDYLSRIEQIKDELCKYKKMDKYLSFLTK